MNTKQNDLITRTDCSMLLKNTTWHVFLQSSRITNAEQGGWDNKSYWITYGLDKLSDAKIIKQWTANSLTSESRPLIRKENFKFQDRQKALDDKKRGAKKIPKEGTENRINWDLSNFIYNKIKVEKSLIATYELPLTDEKRGQLKADIVIFSPKKNLIEIIELKEKNSSNSPLMALVESICYTLQFLRCWKNIKSELTTSWLTNDFPKINIIIAAPSDYWTNYGFAKKDETAFRNILKNVEEALPKNMKTKLSLVLANCVDDGNGGLQPRSKGDDADSPIFELSLKK